MGLRKLFLLVTVMMLAGSSLLGTATVPRKSPELNIQESSGKQTTLSSFKGKVVVVEFLLTNCPHCIRVARTMAKLQAEMGPRGFEAIGVAFDNGVTGKAAAKFGQDAGLSYPLGSSSSAEVDKYLGRAGREQLSVPQIVVIDRGGVIRAQSRPIRETNLEDENYLRNLIDTLLKEHPATSKR